MAKANTAQNDGQVMIRDLHLYSKKNYWRIKRTFDVILSGLMLLVLSPLFLVIALLIKRDDPKGPVFYSQMRCGRGSEQFRMYKFRSMCVDADKMLEKLKAQNEMSGPAFKMRNDPRITPIGRVLRATNLDELPQLINIFRGDMSFVGPRPPLPNEVKQYTAYQYQRLYVTPGLTCYWQIADNRNDLPFEKWLDLDVQYVIDRSIWVDIKIIFQTALSVVKRTGR